MELASNHSFPRHTHDEYGIGVVLSASPEGTKGRTVSPRVVVISGILV
jgi:hypothetical protein